MRRRSRGPLALAVLGPLACAALGACASTPQDPLAAELRRLEQQRPAEPQRRPLGGADRSDPAPHQTEPRPPAAESPLTARFETSIEDGGTQRVFLFTRHKDRVGVRDRLRGVEWQFVRNPVRPEQLTACRVDHGSRQLVFYSYPDLADVSLPTDWHQLSFCGVDPGFLSRMQRSGATETAFGIEFDRWVRPAGVEDSALPHELLWNAEHHVPLRVVFEHDGRRLTQRLVSLRLETPESARLLLAQRFRAYARSSVTAYREEHLHCAPLLRGR